VIPSLMDGLFAVVLINGHDMAHLYGPAVRCKPDMTISR
jgi:hypothetical protein